ncbi:MAG: bifunctional 4-hydroxy-2-oxoglutarate aldolase/2-dehydro-3-deoxy-phosphogluconate aldolase [Armatimonadota bacterium]
MNANYDVFSEITRYRVIPVIAIESAEAALSLADALAQGGLPVAEITFRTDAAAETISLLKKERPELILGAGTVLTLENLLRAKDCGASFAVAPGTNPEIVRKANEIGLPFVPGVATASEIEQALSLGCRIQKFFPSEASGGVAMIKALSAPYAHTGVRFVPTGGITVANLADYLSLPTVAAVGGTWIATKEDISAGRWQEITRRCEEACRVVRSLAR